MMTDIKASLKLRQHEGWKEMLEYIEYLEGCHLQLEKALGVAKDVIEAVSNELAFISYACAGDPTKLDELKMSAMSSGRLKKALKEISDIMGGG